MPRAMWHMLVHASGRLLPEEAGTFVPEMEWPRVYRQGHACGWWCSAAVVATTVATGSILPLLLIGRPRIYGPGSTSCSGVTQHAGLAEDTLDHRLNTRTIYMNPVFRFLYWNMNYHIEHHMFPMVPFHTLPELHEEVKQILPAGVSEHDRCLSGDHPDARPPAPRPELLRAASAAGGGRRLTKKPPDARLDRRLRG